MKYTLMLLVAAGLSTPLWAYDFGLSSCEKKHEDRTSACRTQGNRTLTDLSQCQIRVNRDYANCTKRGV